MNRNRERKKRLYDTFAANLALYWGDSNDQFICPLCMRLFDRDAIDHLDLAHIVPNALGGSKVTLTCKQCNNRIGAEIECHEVEAAHIEQAFKSKESKPMLGRIRLRCNGQESGSVGITMNGVMGDTMPELYVKPVDKMSDPAEIQRIHQMFEQAAKNGGDWGIELEWRNRVDPHRAQLTYLHIAYLYLFHQFGYEWTLDPCTVLMREQFQRPDEELINVRLLKATPHQEHPQTWGVNIIYAPEEALGLLVTVPPMQHLGAWATVWMPLFGCSYNPPATFAGSFSLTSLADLHSMLNELDARLRGRRVITDVIRRKAPDLFARLQSTQSART